MSGTEELAGFTHVFVPAASGGPAQARTLLLLHGTGGDEQDLLPLGRQLAPDANLLSPRGQVLEHGMPRFFRRLREGVLDVPDLHARSHALADFVAAAAEHHGFDARRVTALGYSNGANIASGLLLLRPETLSGAALMRAMVPFEPAAVPDLSGRRVLIVAGRHDPYGRSPVSETLARIFAQGGAKVDLHWSEAGHELTQPDLHATREWLSQGKP